MVPGWFGCSHMSPSHDSQVISMQSSVHGHQPAPELSQSQEPPPQLYSSTPSSVGGTSVMEHPAVELAASQFIDAYLEYNRQQIRAPVSGYVAKRKAQVGDRVAPGAQLMTIVPLDHLWVEANLRETEVRHVQPGQSALVSVDLYGKSYTFHGVVEGLVPGTGSAFALLPPDNSTGNFIHIVERVPVRIGLPVDELRHLPIRPGLSTVTSINIKEPGRSAWTSLATASGQDYETNVFEDEFSTAQVLSEEIILKNLVWDTEHPAVEERRPAKPIKARDDNLPISKVKTNANAS